MICLVLPKFRFLSSYFHSQCHFFLTRKEIPIFTAEIEKENLTSLVNVLEELGGWPILGTAPGGNWNAASFDLMHLLLYSVSSAFFEVGLAQGLDQNNPLLYKLGVSE